METLCAIRDIYKSISEYETNFQQAHGLCLNEGMLLCVLSKHVSLTSGEIAETLALSASNTSKVIKSVENKKYIKRILGKSDKRQMFFALTKLGIEKIKDINCKQIQIPDLLQSKIG